MCKPLFSIVIPTRGRPHALLRAISAVRAQTVQEWEAVVVDDGAGEAIEAVAALVDDRVRALPNVGCGVADARTTGIAAAAGEFLCWLDDDDEWLDDRHLEAVAAVLGGDARRVAHRGGWLVRDDGGEREQFDWPATPASLRVDNTVLTSSIAYSRSLHLEIGLLDRSVGGYCDWDLLLCALAAGWQLMRVPGLGIAYAVHAAATSSDYARPERLAFFERFQAKHGLAIEIKSHATLHEDLAACTRG